MRAANHKTYCTESAANVRLQNAKFVWMDYVLLPKRMLGRFLDGEGGGMSEIILVEARLKLEGGWRSARRMGV